jgi:hypothetical protein
MSTISTEIVRDSVLKLLKEAYPCDSQDDSWFTWGRPEDGVIGALDSLTATEASTPAHEGGTTVAAIAAHLRFTLQYGNAMWSSRKPEMSWDDSWPIKTVDEYAWKTLRNDIRAAYAASIDLIENFHDWQDVKAVSGSFGHIVHTAYHLGAIRQIIKQING